MLGAAGALCCLACGTGVGLYLREGRRARLRLLLAYTDMLSGLRVLLMQERLGMGELLRRGAELAGGDERLGQRMTHTVTALGERPLEGVWGAYQAACAAVPIAWERAEERELISALFQKLGSGTAAMRQEAVSACLRRLRPLEEQVRKRLEQNGRLCVQLGMLLGLMLGVALW